jgi:hypothetical protein
MISSLLTNECPEVLPKELTCATLRRGKWTVEEERYTEKIIGKQYQFVPTGLLTRYSFFLALLLPYYS